MRTKSTKELEVMSFENLSDWSIVLGAVGTLYHRHRDIIICFAVALSFGIAVGLKI